jgi:hypothetical protein
MPTTAKKSARLRANEPMTIELQPHAKQVDFNSKEMRDELDKVKRKIQDVLDNSMVDTKKLSIHFTV